jgi:hypothetical protein
MIRRSKGNVLRLATMILWIWMPYCVQAQGGYIEEGVWSNVDPASGLVSDFIITSDGAKLFGEIIRNFDYAEYEKVDFEYNGGIKTYLPSDLKAFGLVNGRFFISKRLSEGTKPEFIQVLLSGKLQLSYRKGEYYLDNGTEIQHLRSFNQKIPGPGSSKSRQVKLYISTLKINTAGICGMDLTDLIENSKIDEQDFIQILTLYHECEELPYKLHVEKIPFVKVSPTIALGIGTDFSKGSTLPANRNYSFSNSVNYRAFAGVRLHDFRRFPRSSFDLRVGYLSRSTIFESSYLQSVEVITASQEFTERSVVIPINFNYSILKRMDTEIYLGLVAAVWINSQKDDLAIIDLTNSMNKNEITLIEGAFLSVSKNSFVPGIKLGGNLPISSKKRLFAEIQADYLKEYYTVGIVNLPRFSINRTHVSLQVGLEF